MTGKGLRVAAGEQVRNGAADMGAVEGIVRHVAIALPVATWEPWQKSAVKLPP